MREDWDAAVEAQRGRLERRPSFEAYERLMDCARRAGCAESVRADVKALLSKGARLAWMDEGYAFTLAQILKEEQDWAGVHGAVHGRIHDADRLRQAARWLAKPAPALACELYRDVIDARIKKGLNKHKYQAAVDALLEARPLFESADAAGFENYVRDLRATHRQKRNLIAALDEAL